MHKLLPVCRWEEFHQTAGDEVERGHMVMEAGGVCHCHTVRAADLQSWGWLLFPPAPLQLQRLHLFFITSSWKECRRSPRGQLSHFDPLLLTCNTCSPSHIRRPHSPSSPPPPILLFFKNLSPYYPYLFLPLLLSGGKVSNPVIQVLVSAAPFSSVVTLSLSLRCPSGALTTLSLCINQSPNEPK